MRYSGIICDGCGELFNESDDIVVCPECATPQHRHCYDEKGGCVNEHLHSDGLQWKGMPAKEKQPQLQSEMLICPNCKMQNPKGSTECENCGMKFVVFGMNVVETMQQEEGFTPPEPIAEDKKIPTYEAPFTLGEGEGFEYTDTEPQESSTDEKTEPVYFNENDDENIFKGPYPDMDTTIGVRTNTLGLFIRGNADSYINRFKRSEHSGKLGFNWAAWFFSPLWFFYRKMIKPGIVFLTADVLLGIFATPAVNKMTALYESFLALEEQGSTFDEAAFQALMTQTAEIMVPLLIWEILIFACHIAAGFAANRLYKSYVLQKLNQASQLTTRNEKIQFFTRQGGTSLLYAAAAYFAQYLISMLVSYLMY